MKAFAMAVAAGSLAVLGAALGSRAVAQDMPAHVDDAAIATTIKTSCTVCHLASQYTSQRKSADQWAETVNQMISLGAQVSDEQFDQIVGYLARNHGVDNGAAPANAAAPPQTSLVR